MCKNSSVWTPANIVSTNNLVNVSELITDVIYAETQTPIGREIYNEKMEHEVNEQVIIAQWYIVEKRLGQELKAYGEFVYDYSSTHDVWGRTTAGQSLVDDYVFQHIANNRNADFNTIEKDFVIESQ